MEEVLVKLQEWGALYGLKIVGAITILVLGRIAAGFIRSILTKMMTKSKVEATLVTFVGSVSYVAMMAFVIIAALGKLGVQTTSFVAILGAAGLAIGLALQGSLSNFAAGVLMIIFKPFKVGDFIEGAGAIGIVEAIGIFTTTISSPDNKTIIIPNASITSDNIVNYSKKPTRRVDIVAGCGYDDNLDTVKSVLWDIVNEDERILDEPAPNIAVLELGDSSINFVVRPWVKTENYWDVYFHLQETIKKRFDAEGISIPFPQRDVHLYKTEA